MMKLFKHSDRTHHPHGLYHLPWESGPAEEPTGGWFLAVALLSVAAAAVLVLAP